LTTLYSLIGLVLLFYVSTHAALQNGHKSLFQSTRTRIIGYAISLKHLRGQGTSPSRHVPRQIEAIGVLGRKEERLWPFTEIDAEMSFL